jgi:hypothetical protein
METLVREQELASAVIPAKAGIQEKQELLDPGFHRGDDIAEFWRVQE